MKNILIGGAWPYANGSLHIGHIAALLPGDVLARYYRSKGNQVFYVSGSDCHGTPVTIRAKQEGKTPREISDYYHQEFCEVFNSLGFSYDLYGKTSEDWHVDFVKSFHERLYAGEFVYEKTAPQAYCNDCGKTLTDRLVIGKCPVCGEKTRGDQCESCGAVLEAENIISPTCAECGSIINFIQSKQLYIALSRLEENLCAFLESHPHWRKNAIAFSKRYIDEGLRDRAITRDLEWGIDVPKEGFKGKKIYIWAENVLGYLSASAVVAKRQEVPLEEIWGENARHYYVHGKDNIPFHTIILPSLLLGHGQGLRLPDDIISSEYLTLEGKKISTSQNWAIWTKDIAYRYNPDSIRYFFIINGPEKRDTDFSWREFVVRNNNELLGAYGNLVNRTLAFTAKYLGNTVPEGNIDDDVRSKIENIYLQIGSKIEEGRLKDAIEEAFDLVRFGNKYFDVCEPWKTIKTDIVHCKNTLFNCTQIIANLSVILAPFLPFSSEKMFNWLRIDCQWAPQYVPSGYLLPEVSILFERLDKSIIEEEKSKLKV